MISRRAVIGSSLMVAAGAVIGRGVRLLAEQAADIQAFEARLKAIEAKTGGRLGVGFFDPASGLKAGLRQNERFAMCSSFKVLAAAALLARVDRGQERLDRVVHYTQADLVTYSPVTSLHVQDGMTLEAICSAAMTRSDNSAANLILNAIGGPPAVTAFMRSMGDEVTRLDRNETALNDVAPGDVRDTTEPGQMAVDLSKLVLGNVLTPASRTRLTGWLEANATGSARIRAGLPAGWRVGDRTGTNTGTSDRDEIVDIAVLWPPSRPDSPVFLCVYVSRGAVDVAGREAAIAEVARAAVKLITP